MKHVNNFNLKIVILSCLGVGIIVGQFIFTPVSFYQVALALQGEYNLKTIGDDLTATEWNYLDEDFLATDGTNMMGADLNMNSNTITGLATPASTDTNNAATVGYVNSQVVAASGNTAVYVNWGREDCSDHNGNNVGTRLYRGYGFAIDYQNQGGSSRPLCVKFGDPGGVAGNFGNSVHPLGTDSNTLPPDISPDREIKCAVCSRPNSICFESWGGWSCDGGFATAFEGWSLGGTLFGGTSGWLQQTDSICVNRNFDSTVLNNSKAAIMKGTTINRDGDSPPSNLYTDNSYLKCSVCCL